MRTAVLSTYPQGFIVFSHRFWFHFFSVDPRQRPEACGGSQRLIAVIFFVQVVPLQFQANHRDIL